MKPLKWLAGLSSILICSLVNGAEPVIEVFKSPHCSCCSRWEAILEENGYQVISHPTDEMRAVKSRLGVPDQLASCHTAVVQGYFLEGHVPVSDIRRLIAEQPEIHGLSVPGMPAGENVPGMETRPGNAKFKVWAVEDGRARVFSRHE